MPPQAIGGFPSEDLTGFSFGIQQTPPGYEPDKVLHFYSCPLVIGLVEKLQ
jgi:hypothetical protein